ncbi:MAG: UPF0104 family protein [Gammaproteobacteria bacterium]|nr:UPF0104 family protein [Gammaproteobacteria bacterium]MCP5424675.1 UPF0104 family protein [Gammaproteobacteria bacterium]
MKTSKNILKWGVGPLIAGVLCILALTMIGRILTQYSLHDILNYLQQLPASTLWLALGCVALSYLTMTVYDVLAMRYIRRALPWSKVGMAAFISYAFSLSLGCSVLTSGSLRYRFYVGWGLSFNELVQVVAFTVLTGWLGILTIGGGMLIWQPFALPVSAYLPTMDSAWLGAVMLALPLAYLLLNTVRRQPLQWGRWALPMVGPKLAGLQIGLGLLDWVMASTVLYVLLPPSEALSFGFFLGVFLLAQTTALISHVPAGVGVFESVVLLLLSSYVPAPQIFGALLVYRVVFYLLPLLLAALLLGLYEGWAFRAQLLWLPQRLGSVLLALQRRGEWLVSMLRGKARLLEVSD